MLGIRLREPDAYLIATGQSKCINTHERPPREVIGSRIAIVSGTVNPTLLSILADAGYSMPLCPELKANASYRVRCNELPGRMVQRHAGLREWVKNPKYGDTELEFCRFNVGQTVGSVEVVGFVVMENGKATGQFRPGSTQRFRLPKGARGTYCWVLRDFKAASMRPSSFIGEGK